MNSHEVVGIIPDMPRFKPEESIVFLPMGSDLPVARVDLPTTPRDRETVWRTIRDAYGRYSQPGSSLAIVCLTADREMATDVRHEFAARFDTRVMLWADETRGANLDTGDMGLHRRRPRADRHGDRPDRTSPAGRQPRLPRRAPGRRQGARR